MLMPKVCQPSEAQVQAAICSLLELLGLVCTVSDSGRVWNRHGRVTRPKLRRGWPDVSFVIPPNGRAAYFEVKSDTGRVRSDQSVMIQQLRDSGAFVAVVRSLDDAIFELNGWLPMGSRPRQIFDRLHYQRN